MKFGEYLKENLTPEWSSQYIAYESLKKVLYEFITEIPQNTTDHLNQIPPQHLLRTENIFFQSCEKEMYKIKTFFSEQVSEASSRFEFLKNQLGHIQKINKNENSIRSKLFTPTQSHEHKKFQKLKLGFSELYLLIILLKNYQILNTTGFRKIMKKHDKLFKTTSGEQWRKNNIEEMFSDDSLRLEIMISEIEEIYMHSFKAGDRKETMKKLHVPSNQDKTSSYVIFRLGALVGMICVLIIVGVSLIAFNSSKTINWRAGIHLYRWSLLIILLFILIGFNSYTWSKCGVNHILLFQINPRDHLTYQHLLEIGAFLMFCWLLSVIGFLLSFYLNAYPFIQPFIFVIFFMLFFLNPFNVFYRNSRFWLIKRLFYIFSAPFHRAEFVDIWLGDQLCSLELAFFDLDFFFCFYLNEINWKSSDANHGLLCNGWYQFLFQTILLIFPSWFRLLQCIRRYRDTKQRFPHLVNAGKYASDILVSITNGLRRLTYFNYNKKLYENPFVYLWIFVGLVSSVYKVIWDIKMDWGLWDRKCTKNKFLREQIIYSKKIYYYLSMIVNIILRFIWTINIFIQFDSLFAEYADISGLGFGLAEVIRRFIWNYFRLENEHLGIRKKYRAVRHVSIDIKPMSNQNLDRTQVENVQIETTSVDKTLDNFNN